MENFRKVGFEFDVWVDGVVEYFWIVEVFCIVWGKILGCEDIFFCEFILWSLRLLDFKLELGKVKFDGRLW